MLNHKDAVPLKQVKVAPRYPISKMRSISILHKNPKTYCDEFGGDIRVHLKSQSFQKSTPVFFGKLLHYYFYEYKMNKKKVFCMFVLQTFYVFIYLAIIVKEKYLSNRNPSHVVSGVTIQRLVANQTDR